MKLRSLLTAMTGIAASHAFENTSPFVFFSTSEILLSSPQITTAQTLTDSVHQELSKCPSDVYVVANQPGVHSGDFQSAAAAPRLRKWVKGEDKAIRSSLLVSEVMGEVSPGRLVEALVNECGAGTLHADPTTGLFDIVDSAIPRIVKVDLPTPPSGDDRAFAIRANDLFLWNLVENLNSKNFSVVLTTTPRTAEQQQHDEAPQAYQMDTAMSPLVHVEMKRDLSFHERAATNDSKQPDVTLVDGPLFERYQYFTPGIFMGLLTMFFLSLILYVAIVAVAGLKVSYGAFDPTNSPAAQKKQQQ